MEMNFEMITKLLKDSDLKGHKTKTEIFLFHCNHSQKITIISQNIIIISKKSMNMLGVVFDSKFNWSEHVLEAVK
jgi:hypothetical protein